MSRTQSYSVPQALNGKTLSDTFLGKVFDTRVTMRDTTLPASNDYIVEDSIENSASYVLEVPATSTLEVLPLTKQPEAQSYFALYDFIEAGCVWTADSAGASLNGTMTDGYVWINGRRLRVNAVRSHAFTASRDTYVDFSDNGDGTAKVTYTEVTNNLSTGSPTLAQGSLRNAVIVTAAGSIAATTSINQGDTAAIVPVVSSVTYHVTDSLGNLICPRDSSRRIIGHRQFNTQQTGITAEAALTGISAAVIVPNPGRNLKFTLTGEHFSTVAGDFYTLKIKEDGTLITGMATQGPYTNASGQQQFTFVAGQSFRTGGAHTYTATLARGSGTGTISTFVNNQPVKLLIELE